MSGATSTTNEASEDLVGAFVRIRRDQREWVQEKAYSLSRLVRKLLDEERARESESSPTIRRDERERARTR